MSTDHLDEHPWYMGVFLALAILAAMKVVVSMVFHLGPYMKFLVLSLMGFSKAALVALYFMHLKFEDWKLIFFVLTPVACTALLIGYILVETQLNPAALIFSTVAFLVFLGLTVGGYLWAQVAGQTDDTRRGEAV